MTFTFCWFVSICILCCLLFLAKFLVLTLTAVRDILRRVVFKPLARLLGVNSHGDFSEVDRLAFLTDTYLLQVEKFSEMAWQFMYYLVAWLVC